MSMTWGTKPDIRPFQILLNCAAGVNFLSSNLPQTKALFFIIYEE